MRRCIRCEAGFDGPRWTCPTCGFVPKINGSFTSFCTAQAGDGFDPDAFASLAELEEGSFWFGSRNLLIAWAMGRYFPDAHTLLEIGCGTGFVLDGLRRALPQLCLTGADLHADGLRYASERLPDVEFLQFDARQMPYDAEFDVIGAFDALEHVEDDTRVLREMRRAVRPGGGVLIAVPQHRRLWSVADEHGEHKRRYSRSELLSKVSATGLSIRRVTSFVTFLLPPIAVVRLSERYRSRPFDPSAELASTHRASAVLGRIMTMERALLTRGVDLPVGLSLLLVASRP
jgi:ubiquinone/menaquinone biosynthesis C-methylase UbiE